MDKNNLFKLLEYIAEISSLPENKWFAEEINNKFKSNTSKGFSSNQIDEIYEYCIEKIIKEHSIKFYHDFKLEQIKPRLIDDFVRMETFRRKDNFEDFCLAAFQQIENIVNHLSNDKTYLSFLENIYEITHKTRNKQTNNYDNQMLWQLIFFPGLSDEDLKKKISKHISEWEFMERFKLILFFFYYNKKIYNYQDFQTNYFLCNELYQSRNLNHRGGIISSKQKITVEKVILNSHKYYFKFLGFLEDFTTKINSNI